MKYKTISTWNTLYEVFKNLLGWNLEVNFPPGRQLNQPGMILKSSDVTDKYIALNLKHLHLNDPKTQKWLNNIYLSNIALAIKASLRVENRTQYMNHQMNSTVKNQIYSKKSQCISLYWLFGLMYERIVSLSPRLVYPLSYDTHYHVSEQRFKTINISRRSVSLGIIGDCNFEFALEWCIQGIKYKFTWKFGVETLIN